MENHVQNEVFYYLSHDLLKEPALPIYQFFDTYSNTRIREYCFNMLMGLIETENFMRATQIERSNFLFFFHKLEALLEANYLIYETIYGEKMKGYCRHRRNITCSQ